MAERTNGLPRAHRWAGVSGIATGLLFALANSLWAFDQPDFGASSAELLHFYGDLSGEIVAGALLSLVSVATFVVFASALREVLAALEGDALLANVAFGGTLLGAATGVGAETINMAAALRAGDGELTAPLAQALFDTSYVLGYHGAGVGLALVALATSAVAMRAGALMPRWLAVVGLLLGATLITPLVIYTIGPSFLFIVVIGALLLRGAAVRA
jgi:pimeloyl-ACP methyl ester carboxylesterase